MDPEEIEGGPYTVGGSESQIPSSLLLEYSAAFSSSSGDLPPSMMLSWLYKMSVSVLLSDFHQVAWREKMLVKPIDITVQKVHLLKLKKFHSRFENS